ncbi:uncharacterized protein DS421_12g370810 [Arachis hypogaea]|nr:uncharacterized protein DS421_12g370810 [Arachis hypogaea]
MRAYLDNACDNLHVPGPIYRILVQRVPDGQTCYRHLVSVMPPSSSEALGLYKTNDTYIHDYNYNLAERWKQKCTLEARLKDVTESNDALQERLFTLDMLFYARHGATTSNGSVGGAST